MTTGRALLMAAEAVALMVAMLFALAAFVEVFDLRTAVLALLVAALARWRLGVMRRGLEDL